MSSLWAHTAGYRITSSTKPSAALTLLLCDAARRAAMSLDQNKHLPPQVWGHTQEPGGVAPMTHATWLPVIATNQVLYSPPVTGLLIAVPDSMPMPVVPKTVQLLGGKQQLQLSRDDDLARQFVAEHQTWTTITPMALRLRPTHKKRPNGRISRRRQPTKDQLATEVAQACERARLPRPVDVQVSTSPWVKGAMLATGYVARRQQDEVPRRLVHAKVSFPEPVVGPVAVGYYAHFGLGLMVPWDASA